MEIDARHRRHDGNNLFMLELGEEPADQRVRHRLVDEVDVEERGRIGDRGMPAIEDADLHQFVGRDVIDEHDADILQRRPAGGKTVFDDPLPEAFAEHRPFVRDVEQLGRELPLPIRRGRGDAVDHAVRKRDMRRDPVGEGRIREPRQPDQRILRDVAVARYVVARHHRERFDAALPPEPEPRQDDSEDGSRILRRRGVGCDRGMARIEDAGCRVDEVAALRDRQRHDADRRIGELFDQRGPVAGRQVVDHRRRHPPGRAVGLLLDHGRQPVLRGELLAGDGIRRHHAGADDRPVVVTSHAEQVVEIDGLMRAVKIADSEMQDAGAQRPWVVAGSPQLGGQPVDILGAEPY